MAPSAKPFQDSVQDLAFRDFQIENPPHATLIDWFGEPEKCGSPASRSWHFQVIPVAKPKLACLLSSRPSFVIRRIGKRSIYPSHDPFCPLHGGADQRLGSRTRPTIVQILCRF